MNQPKKERFKTSVGGQALMEGIMMRGPKLICCAVRKPDGTIETKIDPVKNHGIWTKIPLVRGAISMIESLIVGYRYMMYSAQVSMGDDYDPEEEETAFEKWVGDHLGKKAEAALPSWTLDDLQEGAAVARALPREDPSSFSEPVNTQQENPMHAQNSLQEEKEADLIRREQELARKEAAFHERERTADAAAFVADMLAEGRLTPAQSAGLAEFMAKLDTEGVVEFAEGSGTKPVSYTHLRAHET